MFDIGWSELVVIAVVALIAIGPKELPGVLRMLGQWMAKARKMAAEFQGQFQEAMREAEMAELKKSFDEVRDAASGFAGGNVITSLQRDVSRALDVEEIDKPSDSAARPAIESSVGSTEASEPSSGAQIRAAAESASSITEAELHATATEPSPITPEASASDTTRESPAAATALKDAKAS
jgi:sec-independent protein translocase protein TatB